MAKKKASVDIGFRAYEEFCRIFGTEKHGRIKSAIRDLGCDRKTPYGWRDGAAPEVIYLQRLCELGADVTWILTGRTKGDNHDKK